VERITYQNPDTGYTVARIAPERADAPLLAPDDRLVPIVGTLPDLTPGDAIVAHSWRRCATSCGRRWPAQATRARGARLAPDDAADGAGGVADRDAALRLGTSEHATSG
jgi:hypothetical protein